MTSPALILDRQADLMSRLEGNDFRVNTFRQIAKEARSNFPDAPKDLIGNSTGFFVNSLANAVKAAYAYRVTEDMVDMVRYAASQLGEDDIFDRSLAPTGCGFLHFDKPLVVGSWSNGSPLTVDYLVWGPSTDGSGGARLNAFFFADPNRPGVNPDPGHTEFGPDDEWARQQGPWDLIGWDSLGDGRSLGPQTVRPMMEVGETVTGKFGAGTPRAGAQHRGADHSVVETNEDFWEYAPEQENDARLIHALFLLLNQTVTATEIEEPDRAGRKRAVRKGLPPRVTVIRLRREVSSLGREPGESHVEWQHRWIVRGFWRWQHYGTRSTWALHDGKPGSHMLSTDGTCTVVDCDYYRRRIWINPYVKGPVDKPLKQSEKVYSLER